MTTEHSLEESGGVLYLVSRTRLGELDDLTHADIPCEVWADLDAYRADEADAQEAAKEYEAEARTYR